MEQQRLYRCCNTCAHKGDNPYHCNKEKECYNGFSAYEPNQAMREQEELERSSEDEQNKN